MHARQGHLFFLGGIGIVRTVLVGGGNIECRCHRHRRGPQGLGTVEVEGDRLVITIGSAVIRILDVSQGSGDFFHAVGISAHQLGHVTGVTLATFERHGSGAGGVDDHIDHLGQAGTVTAANGRRCEAQALGNHGVVGHLEHGQHGQHYLAIYLATVCGFSLQRAFVILELALDIQILQIGQPLQIGEHLVDRDRAAIDPCQGGGEVVFRGGQGDDVLGQTRSLQGLDQ
ncbi:hypothetical protein D3C87_946730 [compost metagenome]